MRIRITLLAIALIVALSHCSLADAPTAGFDAEKNVPHGKLETLSYLSKTLGFDRPVIVYLPPGYNAGTKYPVLYLLHGAGDDEKGWNTKGAAANILDNLYADAGAKMTPMIVVMPYGFAKKADAPMPTDAQERQKLSRNFDDDFIKDLIPFIEAKYPTLTDAGHRAVGGLSMGGSQSLRNGLQHLELFSTIGCFSSMLRDPLPEPIAKVLDDAAATNAKLKLFYVSTGDKDRGFEMIKKFHELLEKKGIKHRWEVKSGTHEWKVWRESLYEFAPLVFK
jgi:enterochelin esterase-like enzyme